MTTSTSQVPSIESISGDKDRINALFAPFRPRDANPEHYDRKLKFWRKAVEEYAVYCNKISFTVKEIQNEFKIDGRSPVCLGEVISHVYRDGVVVTENDFNESLKSAESWTAWSQISTRKVLRKVGSYVPSPLTYFYKSEESEIRYINADRLKALTETALTEPSLISKLMSLPTWKSKINDTIKLSNPTDLDYLIAYLKMKRYLIFDKIGSEEVLIMSSKPGDLKIGDVEKGKYDICRTKEILETQLSEISMKAQQAEERARAALKQNRRNTAKHELRRKKLLEQRMDKLLTMVDNLSVLEMQIEDAQSDAALISAYEAGKKALSGVLEDKRLNADRVTEAMLDIQDLLDQHSDVSAALSQPMDNNETGIDELEEELESLMKEDEHKLTPPTPLPTIPQPAETIKLNDEEEALKLLKELDLIGLEEFSSSMSATGKLDKSGDV